MFLEDKFSNTNNISLDELKTMLTVDRENLDCEMSEEYLEKVLDVTKYQDNSKLTDTCKL